MLTENCNHLRPEQGGCTQYHNKDTIVSNLCFLFKNKIKVYIDTQNGILKYCINKSSDEIYWNKLIQCLLQPRTKSPARPET